MLFLPLLCEASALLSTSFIKHTLCSVQLQQSNSNDSLASKTGSERMLVHHSHTYFCWSYHIHSCAPCVSRPTCCGPCRVPLQYLNNCCHWRDMILAVGPGVLIPRPETELLIDFASQVWSQNCPDVLCTMSCRFQTLTVLTDVIVVVQMAHAAKSATR